MPRPSAAALALLALLTGAVVSAGLLAGCGPSATSQRAPRLQEGRDKLEKDPSAALFIARDALEKFGEDPQLELLAATACLKLSRRSEALDSANKGLTAANLEPDLEADLNWARGTALMGRSKELNDLSDWRSANSSLERATAAGNHRADAATLLVGLQDMSSLGSPERQLKFARMLFELEPATDRAQAVRKLLDAKGLKP